MIRHVRSVRCSIALNPETRDLLKKVGRMDQTYNDLILELISLKLTQEDNPK